MPVSLSALPATSRPAATDPLEDSRRLLRRLLDENLSLRRELGELRLLRRLAHQNTLTGLPNRRLFEDRLAEELSRARRDPTCQGSLLVVDVNDLKLVNDSHGRKVGDELLRDVAAVLRCTLRTVDVCSRTGGDQFMILLSDTDAQGARLLMARLRAGVMRAGSRLNVSVSISIGSASWPVDGKVPAKLIEKADRAMNAQQRCMRARGRRRPPKFGGKLELVR